MKLFHPNGFAEAQEMMEDAFETLLAEGERGQARLANFGHHLRIGGRPGRLPAFVRLLTQPTAIAERIWAAQCDTNAFAARCPP